MEAKSPAPQSLHIAIAGANHPGRSGLALPAVRDAVQVTSLAAVALMGWFAAHSTADIGKTAADSVGHPGAPPHRLVVVFSIGRLRRETGSGRCTACRAALGFWADSVREDLQRVASGRLTVAIVEPGLVVSGMTRTTGPARWLRVSRRPVVRTILTGEASGSGSIRPPPWFSALAFVTCLAVRPVWTALFGRIKLQDERA